MKREARTVKTALILMVGTGVVDPVLATENLVACEDEQLDPGARCGHITVFEDRAAQAGRTLDLHVVVLPATGSEVKEPLFFLAGGPGQANTDLVQVALGLFASVREHRDMVFVDQRGTGRSGRIDCPVDAAETPQDVFGNLFDPGQIRQCLKEVKKHADPTLYTTDLAVDDLDEVRQRLGYEKVLLRGGSGGTRTALVWMRRHPDSVVGALLDGVVPTDFRAPSTMARGCQDTLNAVISECNSQDDCHTAFPRLAEDFQTAFRLFKDGPVNTFVVDPQGNRTEVEMHRGDFNYAVRGVMYSARSLPKLPAMIHQAAETGRIQPFAQAYWQRQVGLRPYVAMGVHFGVYCSEDLPFIGEEEVAGFTEGSFVGRYLYDQYLGACEEWEVKPVDRSYLRPIESENPVLLYSGYYDPSTPSSLGEQVAAHLPNSRHVMVRNESHGSAFGCGRAAAIQFLIAGSLEGLGPICEDVGPIEYEVSP